MPPPLQSYTSSFLRSPVYAVTTRGTFAGAPGEQALHRTLYARHTKHIFRHNECIMSPTAARKKVQGRNMSADTDCIRSHERWSSAWQASNVQSRERRGSPPANGIIPKQEVDMYTRGNFVFSDVRSRGKETAYTGTPRIAWMNLAHK